MVEIVWDAFEAGGDCSCDIVTRTKLNTMVTKSSSSRCSLLG